MKPPFYSYLRRRLGPMPLRRKLQLKAYLIAVVAALVVSAVFAVYRLIALRENDFADAVAITRMLSENATGPIAFQDATATTAVLASLRAKPAVRGAVVDLPDHPNFATFGVPPPLADRLPASVSTRFHGWVLSTTAEIGDEEGRRARLQIVFDLGPELWATLRAVGIAFATALTLALLISHAASERLRRFILGPIESLHATTQKIGVQFDYSHRAPIVSSDELAELTIAFNRMLDRLQAADQALRTTNDSLTSEIAERKRLERALVDASRQAGMAEVATGILHNVGNVLNSVNISLQVMRENLERSQLGNLQRGTDMITAQGAEFARFVADDPKGRLLPSFIVKVAAVLRDEHAAAAEELARLAKNIEHIKEIVAAQQSFAKTVGVAEQVNPREMVDEAEHIAQASAQRHGIEIAHDFSDAPSVLTDRHKVLQILVNFITNAIHAVKPNAPGNRRITLRLASQGEGVVFTIADNGVGIAAENLNRIFTHGFTTRSNGHGFGLHSGALAARQLGGRVAVTSDGPGRGAAFVLELPAQHTPAASSPALETAAAS
ncbi:MAG TPA: ATP-binding protein [Opitutaceae bacterium]|jgi:signal transduction histidine kinase